MTTVLDFHFLHADWLGGCNEAQKSSVTYQQLARTHYGIVLIMRRPFYMGVRRTVDNSDGKQQSPWFSSYVLQCVHLACTQINE